MKVLGVLKHLLLVPVFVLVTLTFAVLFIFRTVLGVFCDLVSKVGAVCFVVCGCLFLVRCFVGQTGVAIIDSVSDRGLESSLVVSFVAVSLLRLVDLVFVQGVDDTAIAGVASYRDFADEMSFSRKVKAD